MRLKVVHVGLLGRGQRHMVGDVGRGLPWAVLRRRQGLGAGWVSEHAPFPTGWLLAGRYLTCGAARRALPTGGRSVRRVSRVRVCASATGANIGPLVVLVAREEAEDRSPALYVLWRDFRRPLVRVAPWGYGWPRPPMPLSGWSP